MYHVSWTGHLKTCAPLDGQLSIPSERQPSERRRLARMYGFPSQPVDYNCLEPYWTCSKKRFWMKWHENHGGNKTVILRYNYYVVVSTCLGHCVFQRPDQMLASLCSFIYCCHVSPMSIVTAFLKICVHVSWKLAKLVLHCVQQNDGKTFGGWVGWGQGCVWMGRYFDSLSRG